MEFYLIRDKPLDIVTTRTGGLMKMSGPLEVVPELMIQNPGVPDLYCRYFINSLIENSTVWKDQLNSQSKINPCLRMYMVKDKSLSPDKQFGSIIISEGRDDAAEGDNILERLRRVHGENNVTLNVKIAGLNYDGITKFNFEGKDLKIKLVATDDKERYGCKIRTEDLQKTWGKIWSASKLR